MQNTVRAEFHCHTEYSADSLVKVEDLLSACVRKGIDKIAITDHNDVEGALIAREMDPNRVIIGEEIMTTEGEILGYFLKEWIQPYMSPMKTIEALKKQNAFISVAHPFDTMRGSYWRKSTLVEMMPHLDALEVFNARCRRSEFNDMAYLRAEQEGLLKLVGSDAHSLIELGRATLIMPEFSDANSLRKALPLSEFNGELSGAWVHLISTYAKFHKRVLGREMD